MGIVMGDSVGHRCWSRVMRSANTSDHDAKIFRQCARRRGRGECHSAVEPFGDAIELELRSKSFGDAIEGGIWGVCSDVIS